MKNSACRKLGAQHLTLGLDSGKAELLQEAYRNVIEKEGGPQVIARKSGIPIRQLKKVLADRETFQLWVDIAKIVKALGGHMAFSSEKA